MPVDDDLSQYGFASLGIPLRDVPALDRPNQDRIIRRWELFTEPGAPTVDSLARGMGPRDARLYLDVKALEYLLDQARSSLTQRVVIHGLVIEVELRENSNGHRYQVAKFRGVPAPEWSTSSGDLKAKYGG